MSKYTTGEIAKLCNVTVRTVQYYDTRGILIPSQLSEGGRRLYSQEDLKKMKIICFLRDMGFSINSISQLLQEENPLDVISILLDQQEQEIRQELEQHQLKLDTIEEIKREIKGDRQFSLESICDIALVMKNKNQLKKLRVLMIAVCVIMDLIEISTAVLWWQTGMWWPFAVGMCVAVILGIWISVYYFNRVAYICPHCHQAFKPKLIKAISAYHTPRTRKLTCSNCGHTGFCVEVYKDALQNNDKPND